MTNTEIHCRLVVICKDMTAVLDLEKRYCREILSEDQIITLLRNRNVIGMLVENTQTDKIHAYMLYELHKDSLLILRFVSNIENPDVYGHALMEKLMGKLSFERRRHLRIAVPEDDLPMQLYFKNYGFRCISIEKEYFDDGMDAYLMQFTLLPNGQTLSGELHA